MRPAPRSPHHHEHVHQEHESPEQAAVRWLAQLQANLADSVNGNVTRGALAVPIGIAAQAMTRPLSNGAGRLCGWTVRESSTTNPLLLRLYDGEDATGGLLATIPLAQGGSAALWMRGGVSITNGLFVQLTALDGVSNPLGALEGVVYLGSAD